MWSNATVIIFLSGYIFFILFGMYYGVMADPDNSPLAHWVQVTVPYETWRRVTGLLGNERVGLVHGFVDRLLVLVYFIVVGGSWSVVFWYLYPWLLFESPGVSDVHAIVGVGVFLACLASWALANSSRPGRITANTFRRYDHYPYDDLLFPPNRRYETTRLPKVPRSKFDRLKYHCVVPRYDHFCGWTYNTYGEENYRWFLLFLVQHVVMCFYGAYVTASLFYDEIQRKKLFEVAFFDRATGQTVQADKFIVFQYFFSRRTLECCVLIIMFVMGIALFWFLAYHVYLTSTGQTTNENSKWGDINQWYKKEQKRYNQAVKDGKVQKGGVSTNDGTSTTAVQAAPTPSDDKDVTCTPSAGGSGESNQIIDSASGTQPQSPPTLSKDGRQREEREYIDPGPVPKNTYDRGFVENWKEVLFPISIRKDALALGGYTKPRGPPPPAKQPQASPAVSEEARSGKPKST